MADTTIHRIQVPPALDARSASRLAADIEEAAAQPRGVIVLVGGDGAFCRGIDLATLLAADDAGTLDDECAGTVDAFVRCLTRLRACDKPVIAAVAGETLGGGVGLVAAADLVVATERSTFGLPETLFGLIPSIVLPVLRDRMTIQKARLMAMTAQAYAAADAHAMGLVDVVTSEDTLVATVRAHARALARTSPEAVAALKRLCVDGDRHAALARAGELTRQLLQSRQVGRAIREFMDGGRLPWEAR